MIASNWSTDYYAGSTAFIKKTPTLFTSVQKGARQRTLTLHLCSSCLCIILISSILYELA